MYNLRPLITLLFGKDLEIVKKTGKSYKKNKKKMDKEKYHCDRSINVLSLLEIQVR